ncbi:uncharacterized protein LOC142363141 isoform X2 [Opisthocomus hoazin]|uniref:uncharacterized protein LOC142363141 isoform X2 n=1 Tax=Opisthocomus hoazin TaxID=30419 RepID=UPI003F53B5C6
MPSAKAGPRHPGGAPQPAQPPALPAHTPRDAGRGGNVAPARRLTQAAVMAGGRRQPSRTLSTANPAVASHPRPRALGKVASPKRLCLGLTTREPVCNVTQELKENRESKEWEPVCNVTWELKENRESKERPVAAGTVLGAAVSGLFAMWLWPAKGILVTHGRWQLLADKQTVSPLPGATAAMNTTWQSSCRCEAWGVSRTPLQQHQAPKAGSAGDQLSQELKRVKNELEQVKGELADKTAQCEAYRRVICSLQAQLRAAGIHLEDVAVEESGDSGRK